MITVTRLVKTEMKESNTAPNFMRVAGHCVTMDYRSRRCAGVVAGKEISRRSVQSRSVSGVAYLVMLRKRALSTAAAVQVRMRQLRVRFPEVIQPWPVFRLLTFLNCPLPI